MNRPRFPESQIRECLEGNQVSLMTIFKRKDDILALRPISSLLTREGAPQ